MARLRQPNIAAMSGRLLHNLDGLSKLLSMNSLLHCNFVLPESNAIPRHTPKALMQRTLSNEAAAITSVGIPFLTP